MTSSIRVETEALLARYLECFPDEADRFALLRRQLGVAGEDPHLRSNMTGHVTASAAVLNPDATKVLLIDHVFLRKWLVPGGHYEPPGGLLASALREVAEETGVVDAVPHAWTLRHGAPLDVDSHDIPAHPRKAEGAHVHHDFMFLATAPEHPGLIAQLAEVHAARWAPVEALDASPDERTRRVYRKLQRVGAV